ncbi:hypothetical protein EG68_02386 [Paragonimus skrjabini miyazakii]|uniref:Enoyl-[acyl-carrier-protein] reductase, mitochondrial n=1 Tax=Paragonimus skrjabini miyazakii TaxID=59628 RepID=A0A8S9Z385_9TREM|nr:hypothetical protein EG68_02386 [Paragonimus skrjabini miyazakii]
MLGVVRRCGFSAFSIGYRSVSSKALIYPSYGEPENVLSLTERPPKTLEDDEVLVKMCAAPVHPSDINTIQGVYAIKPPLPAVPGNEGVGRVITCGSKVDGLTVGDLVVPAATGLGTWQTHLSGKAEQFFRLPASMPISHAAVFRTNPGTAYRMLVDFVQLRPGDIVIQNGATSAVGIYVIQMAKLLGTKTINLFRPRETPEATEKTRQLLLDYGADWALTEAEFNDVDNPIAKDAKTAGSTRLALNCLGGKPALVLLRTLADSGTLVSYGAMTRNPMTIPVGPLIFRDIRLRGFWMTSWIRQSHASRVDQMFKQLCDWFSQQQLKPSPSVEIPFADWKQAIALSKFGDTGPTDIRKKVILKME